MKDEIIEFFGNLENITDFSISKWIRQQTNNLDPSEFCKLSSEFNKYYISREVEETNPPKNNDRLIKNDKDYFNSLSLNYYTIKDNIIQYNRMKFANKLDYDHFDLLRVFSSFQNIMHELFEIIKSKETTIDPPRQNEIINKDEVKTELKEFFNPEINIEFIEKIQSDFKGYKGKKMAYLIYLLHKDFRLINYVINSKTESRKHFVSLLKGTDFRMSGIDKFFELSNVILLNPKFENDPDYIDTKEKLTKTIK